MNSFSTDAREIRKFGLIAFIFFAVLSGIGIWRQKSIPTYLFGSLATLGFGFIVIPDILEPVYRLWLKTAHFIGRVITILILSAAYYLVITPAAILKRMFGGRPLPMAPDSNADTYWISRDEPIQPKERFFKRF